MRTHLLERGRAEEPGTSPLSVSVVIPCLNEAESIEQCVTKARLVLAEHCLEGEVIVVDNGSTDGSGALARAAGASVVEEPRRGYGSAYLAGFAAAGCDVIVMADADLTYDFDEIPRFLDELDAGADLVMGNRMDNIAPGAMPFLNRYVGNPVLSGFLNLLYDTGVKDAHCGMRAVRRAALERLDLRSTGMEFASEMVIRAAKQGLAIREFPIEYHPRGGESKLSPMRDGWRHVRLMLVHNPNALFIYPGVLLWLAGLAIGVTVLADIQLLGREWSIHALIAGSMLFVVGLQVAALGLCARTYGVYFMREEDALFDRLAGRLRVEHGLVAGAICVLVGLVLGGIVVANWISVGGGELSDEYLAVVSATAVVAGIQVFFTSFLVAILGLRRAADQR
jgi:glycosyltransferase involved in cell wall biosynthesis